jgi:predicted ATPase
MGLLTGGARDLPERQRTLRNTLDWSFDLLSAASRRYSPA